MDEYTVVKDGNGWGVMWHDALVNDEPMSINDACLLAYYCNTPDDGYFTDESPLWDEPYI